MVRRRFPMDGKVAIITGAGSGIGRALAVRMSEQGSPVAIADFDADGLAETEAMVTGPVLARTLDVRERSAMMAFAASVDEWAPGPIGFAINNAGVTTSQSFADSSPEDDEWVMDVNFGGVINGSHAFLPLLLKQGEGTLVNVSSLFGLIGFPYQSAYCASKHAVRGFTESLRHEMRGTGVRVAAVHPGGVKTNIVVNARFHADDAGHSDASEAAEGFATLARATPEKAAKIIQSGIEAGKPRIRVGADAVAMDVISRIAPVRYYGLIDKLKVHLGR
ncbi:MAG: SDR family NAD(P)-dependent oxidoreductase [Solirubrobacterales bacterium]|nr:SDR family NAD(P)-dependent oxidoreductase [Solirubrobacterales bacterium]